MESQNPSEKQLQDLKAMLEKRIENEQDMLKYVKNVLFMIPIRRELDRYMANFSEGVIKASAMVQEALKNDKGQQTKRD